MQEYTIIDEAIKGNLGEVRRLIPVSPMELRSRALLRAVELENFDMVALLLPVSDPKINNSVCLRAAARTKNDVMVDLLYDVSEPQKVLKDLQLYNDERVGGYLSTRVKADQERAILQNIDCANTRPLRKM